MEFDVEEFARQAKPPRFPCRTCQEYPEVAAKIRRFLEIKAEHGSEMTVSDLLRALKERMGYRIGRSGLSRHIEVCEKDLHDRIRTR